MNYALLTLWHERQRFLPGVLAVAFSAMLSALQSGLLWGILTISSIPVDATRADIWVGSPDVLSVDKGERIPMSFQARLDDPDIDPDSIEPFLQGFGRWKTNEGQTEMCVILGSKLEDGASGAIQALTALHREKLTEPDSVIVDAGDMSRLGLVNGVGEYGEINGQKVKVVDLVTGYKSIAGPYVMCSLKTARSLMRLSPDQTIYLLARCKKRANAPEVVERLRERYERGLSSDKKKDMSVFTANDFSSRTQMHWLLKTRAGLVIGYAAILGLLVGAVVTSQTLYAATISSIRELAILRALGIPRWRMAAAVLTQSFWVGLLGVILAMPTIYVTAQIADWLSIKVKLDQALLGFVAVVTLLTALLAGLFALRSLRHIEPASLLR